MNIYIYGTKNFKEEINKELKKAHIDYKLSDYGTIEEVSALDTLKALIEDNPNDIYLIDDAKIIKENLLNSKIKFLKPKDGIELEYLEAMGVEQFSVESYAELSRHILSKMKECGIDDDDDEIDLDERNEIQSSISNIVKEAYENEENEEDKDLEEEYELDDDLKSLLASEEENEEDSNFLEKEEKMENKMKPEDIFSLDDLSENDILEALGSDEKLEEMGKNIQASKETTITLNNKEDIQDFLTKLLNSKALEITVKVKE